MSALEKGPARIIDNEGNSQEGLVASLWSTARSVGREAQFVGGAVALAAKESLNSSTAIECAGSLAVGAITTALHYRYGMTNLFRYGSAAALGSAAVGQFLSIDSDKWKRTAAASHDVWLSDKNLTGNIALAKDSIGSLVIDSAVMTAGLSAGAIGGGKLIRSVNSSVGALSRSAESVSVPAYRYFEQSRGGPPNIYRFPANGRTLEKQNIPDVQHFDRSGVWRPNARPALMDEWLKGWFSEATDEISERRALEIISRMSKR